MFSKHSPSSSFEGPAVAAPDVVWSERFRDVTKATVTPMLGIEGKGPSLLLVLELSVQGSANGSTQTAENGVRTTLTVPVEERDVPALLRLLGKNVLLREQRHRASLEKEILELELQELHQKLEAALEREEALRSNLHTLVEGTRRLQ
jgi:hypothetical protein